MRPLLPAAALAALLTLALFNQAEARWGGGAGTWHSQTSYTHTAPGQWTRSGSVTGPRGNTATFAGSTSCAGGACNRTTTYTGPNGRDVTATNSVSLYRTRPVQLVRHPHRPERRHGDAQRHHRLRRWHLRTHRLDHRRQRAHLHHLRQRDAHRAGPVQLVRLDHRSERRHPGAHRHDLLRRRHLQPHWHLYARLMDPAHVAASRRASPHVA